MYKIKHAILKQPLILVLFAILIAISIGEFFNAHSVRKNVDSNYAMFIASVAKLENISEKKDALEIKDYESFASQMDRLTKDADYLKTQGEQAGRFVESLSGATAKVLAATLQ